MTALVCAATLSLGLGVSVANIVAIGDFEFTVDAAGFWDGKESTVEEVYIRFSNSEIRFKENNRRLESRVRLTVLIVDESGKTVRKNDEILTFFAAGKAQAEDPLQFQTVTKRFPLPAGRYRLTLILERRSRVWVQSVLLPAWRL